MADELRLTDGQLTWVDGVDSSQVKTKAIPSLPNGVKPSQLAWLINGTVRGGGITPRASFQPLVQNQQWSGIYQGGLMYQQDVGDPFLLLAIGGQLYQIRVDTDNSVRNLSTAFPGMTMPSTVPQAFFTQTEMFAVWQAGDLTTNPIFYDFGTPSGRPETMRRSNGFVGVANPNNEIPPAGPMVHYAQRLWYAFFRSYCAGDIVQNQSSGTAPYNYQDSVLKVTENPVAYAGDGFSVPTVAGNIRALAFASNLDTALGESNLFVFTRRTIYANSAPITRDDWTKATFDLMPLQKVVLNKPGTYSDRSVVSVNGDLFFQSPPNGDVRSVQTSLRYYGQWGSVPLSTNERRATDVNDRSLLRFGTGIEFDNRLLMSALPTSTPVGVGHQALMPLDFDVISTLQERRAPAWEGVQDYSGGPLILQMFEGDFGGRERAFAVVWSLSRQKIEVWEFRSDLRFDNGENRITMVIEPPAYSFENPMALKELDSGELWFDMVYGTVDVKVYYRPDAYACWLEWTEFQVCSSKDCRELVDNPCVDNGYPQEPFCESDMATKTLMKPLSPINIPANARPATWGYQFQLRLVIKGWCRVRGMFLYSIPRMKQPYYNMAQGLPPTRL